MLSGFCHILMLNVKFSLHASIVNSFPHRGSLIIKRQHTTRVLILIEKLTNCLVIFPPKPQNIYIKEDGHLSLNTVWNYNFYSPHHVFYFFCEYLCVSFNLHWSSHFCLLTFVLALLLVDPVLLLFAFVRIFFPVFSNSYFFYFLIEIPLIFLVILV